MAEGHAIHHLARRLEPLAGTTVRASSPSGAADDLAAIFDRRTPLLAEAHGKHLFWPFEGAPTLHLHLGMFGRVQVGTGGSPGPVARRPTCRCTARCGCG